jgi:hypothetical protein
MKVEPAVVDVIFAAVDGFRSLFDQAEAGLRAGTIVDGAEVVNNLVQRLRTVMTNSLSQSPESSVPRVGDILTELGATTRRHADTGRARTLYYIHDVGGGVDQSYERKVIYHSRDAGDDQSAGHYAHHLAAQPPVFSAIRTSR